jgi:cytosine/adenosine deaminase-related metal-dependent hydrolase
MPIFRSDAEAVPHCVRVALSELLLSGVTTVADLSMAHPGWLDLLAESGLRVCVAPMFRSPAGSRRTAMSSNTNGTRPPARRRWRGALPHRARRAA